MLIHLNLNIFTWKYTKVLYVNSTDYSEGNKQNDLIL